MMESNNSESKIDNASKASVSSESPQPYSRGQILHEIRISKDLARYDALRAFFWSTPVSIGGALLANRYWAGFRKLRTPYKLAITLLVPVGYTCWRLDNNAILAGKRIVQNMYNVSPIRDAALTIPTATELSSEDAPNKFSLAIKNNAGKIILGSWFLAVGGSLLYNWRRKDLTTGQKVVNARVTAQIAALSGLAFISYNIPAKKRKTITSESEN